MDVVLQHLPIISMHSLDISFHGTRKPNLMHTKALAVDPFLSTSPCHLLVLQYRPFFQVCLEQHIASFRMVAFTLYGASAALAALLLLPATLSSPLPQASTLPPTR